MAAEALDHLPEDDPAALRSRRDLQRVHRAMGTRTILRRALRNMTVERREAPVRILELGAGDGSLMLGVAHARLPSWSQVELSLLDRQALVSDATLAGYRAAGWSARNEVVDVFAWASQPADASQRWDLIVANLFMHHFEPPELATLLGAIEARCTCFFACEPRRSRLALVGSHLVGLIGANAVTRNDAVLSVRAGFRDRDLSTLWPGGTADWTLHERAAGPFSHCFTALRREAD
ncbi:MAG: hypothetical protein WKG52_16370 [Variovorax sp.]